MQPPARERPPSSSRSPQSPRLTIKDDDGDESETTESTAALVSPLESDDLVADSLLRLPALPSSLFRASLVCKRWSRVVSKPHFLREFRARHRKPPLLGLFCIHPGRIAFTPMLDPPDKIPASRFALQVPLTTALLCCHHGRVLLHDVAEHHFKVWEPVTGELSHIPKPPSSFVPNKITFTNAAVLCASGDENHVHGACHSDPFKVVVVAGDNERFSGFVYSSETKAWGNFLSVMWRPHMTIVHGTCGNQIFRNSICLLLLGEKLAILEFDWARRSLAFIDVPYAAIDWHNFMSGRTQFLIKTSDGGGDLSFVVQEFFTVHVWKRTSTDSDGVATWMLGNTIELTSALSLGPHVDLQMHIVIMESDDDGNVLFKTSNSQEVFMVNIESRKVNKLPKPFPFIAGHPFSSFYTPGMHVNTGLDDGVEKIPGKSNGCPKRATA